MTVFEIKRAFRELENIAEKEPWLASLQLMQMIRHIPKHGQSSRTLVGQIRGSMVKVINTLSPDEKKLIKWLLEIS